MFKVSRGQLLLLRHGRLFVIAFLSYLHLFLSLSQSRCLSLYQTRDRPSCSMQGTESLLNSLQLLPSPSLPSLPSLPCHSLSLGFNLEAHSPCTFPSPSTASTGLTGLLRLTAAFLYAYVLTFCHCSRLKNPLYDLQALQTEHHHHHQQRCGRRLCAAFRAVFTASARL